MVAIPSTSKSSVPLHAEFRRFTINAIQLRRLYSETLKALDDISSSGVIPRDSLKGLDEKRKDIQKQKATVGRPPSLIVLGQSCKVKAILVNELFHQTHLPVIEASDNESFNWRMVRFKYSKKDQVLLALGSSYEVVENFQDPHWKTVHTEIRDVDLAAPQTEIQGPVEDCAVVEMHLEHPLLCDNVQVVVPPTGNQENFSQILKTLFDATTPIIIYGIADDKLSNEDVNHLELVRLYSSNVPIFFVHMPSSEETSGMTEVDRNEFINHGGLNFTAENDASCIQPEPQGEGQAELIKPGFLHQLEFLGYTFRGNRHKYHRKLKKSHVLRDRDFREIIKDPCWLETEEIVNASNLSSEFIQCLDHFPKITSFVRSYLQSHLLLAASHLHKVHNSCLQMFILSAFEMAREMQITPKRLEYARMKESELFESLLEIAEKKQDEMCALIAETIDERREDILLKAEGHQFKDPLLKNWNGPLSGKLVSQCMDEIRELVALDLNNIIAQKLITSVYCLHDTFLGTLERCICSLERNLEDIEDGGLASVALKQILTSAYQVEVPNNPSSSILRGLFEKMKQLLSSLPWSSVPAVDANWRRLIAADMLESLCQRRLAKAVCYQLRERLRTSHETFGVALKNLETHHNERLERTGEQGFRLRKVHAPRLARLALETSSITDFLLYGMPQCGREIGRGQYGVVYSCESWANGKFAPCAVKSVVPMDDKHWNDLAMEFYFMRSIPEHDRIVRVRGSVIDHSYAGGSIPAVLIVMDRLTRDLYCALKVGLQWLDRLQIALDVVEGIRFLHSQGLVHRDIKLKNILLDSQYRAKLTDLGFCKPEAMMSGSIVGTPIHMAPELFSGQYDNSVDVYAFGILFWYLCSGKVKLPQSFEQCQNKEHLWTSVKKGSRPEKLPYFDESCWRLMESCWDGEPSHRPLLGVVEQKLNAIKDEYEKSVASQFKGQNGDATSYSNTSHNSSEDGSHSHTLYDGSGLQDSSLYLNIELVDPDSQKTAKMQND